MASHPVRLGTLLSQKIWGNLPSFGLEPGHGNHINVNGPWLVAHPVVPQLAWPPQATMPPLALNPALAPAVTGQAAMPVALAPPALPLAAPEAVTGQSAMPVALAPPAPPLSAPEAAGGAARPSRRAPSAPVVHPPLPTPGLSANAGGPSGVGPRASAGVSRRDPLHAVASGVPALRAPHSGLRTLAGPAVPPRSPAEPGTVAGSTRPAESLGRSSAESREAPSAMMTPGRHDKRSPALAGIPPGRYKILVDYANNATTWLSNDLRASGLVHNVWRAIKNQWTDVIRISPNPRDVLVVPRTGIQIGAGTTSQMAIKDGMCTDGFAFRREQDDPVTWAFNLTSGAVKTPRPAV